MSKKIPVTMLSGFLGAGKTTLLRHLLTQTKEKIGCLVNDVAAVNIDSKLIRNSTTTDLADTLELQNGCACCSIQDELFLSFERLMDLAKTRGYKFDRLVLENSGVAEPHNIRNLFQDAVDNGLPLMQEIELDVLVTVVDSSAFMAEYKSREALAARPDLGEGGGFRSVVDLLVEQVECSDLIVLNKIDLVQEASEMDALADIVSNLNPLARVLACSQGEIDVNAIFSSNPEGALVATLNVEGHHRGFVAAAKKKEAEARGAGAPAAKQSKVDGCQDCAEGNHHEHHHGHDAHQHKCDEHCTHDHEHDHGHGHGHRHDHDHECTDAHCTHEHHAPPRDRQVTTAATKYGITNFVYSRRKPFHPQRLRDFVYQWLPVETNRAAAEQGEAEEGVKGTDDAAEALKTVVRSKGFIWLSSSHTNACYWSHAGTHFEIKNEGDWWVTVPEEEWPQDPRQTDIILSDFDLRTPYGDRRQEIVFIGRFSAAQRAMIERQLDAALLSEEEMAKYDKQWATIPDPINRQVLERREKA